MILNLCLNYGGRQEIVEGVNEWLATRRDGESFTVKKMEKHLQTAGLPEVDLIIRTSGEYRISNFLLWQLAYSELAFVDVLWPDFRPEDLHRAVYDYQQRERRFGNI
jgi:undecaprenyl diphosphate synthase